jgi:hypothetical protein
MVSTQPTKDAGGKQITDKGNVRSLMHCHLNVSATTDLSRREIPIPIACAVDNPTYCVPNPLASGVQFRLAPQL